MITLKITTIVLGIFLGRRLEHDFALSDKFQLHKNNQIKN